MLNMFSIQNKKIYKKKVKKKIISFGIVEIKTYQTSVGFFFRLSRCSCILIILIRRITTFIEIPALFGSHCNKQLQKQ